MDKINISFVLSSDKSKLDVSDKFSNNYQLLYKPIISFLYAHPECKFTFSFTGEQLLWYKKHYPEFLKLVYELSSRKQIEVLGGGFYNPLFPLLYPADRSGQIEMLSSELRRTVGRRPRGLLLCASSWDPSLISGFQTCGMEYVILDSSIIPPSKQAFLPIISADKGKSLCVLPSYREFIPKSSISPKEYLDNIISVINKATKHDEYSYDHDDRIVPIILGKKNLSELIKSGWLEDFLNVIKESYSDTVELALPLNYRRDAKQFISAYIPAGISSDIAQWALVPFTSTTNKENFPVTIYDFLRTYPRQQTLYNRMLYISILLNQCHGDKMRKKAAREKLWESQSGEAYICTPDGIVANSKRRQAAYKSLAEAEKLLRESEGFHESITSYDYDCDGINEYVCQMKQYDACIGLQGGSITELDVIKNTGNYADNFSRVKKFDGFTESYVRGLFVDHLLDSEEFDLYKNQKPTGSRVFSLSRYSQVKFNSARHEIQLEATDSYSSLKQPVKLRKNYMVTSNGLLVQYILKNESPLNLTANLIIESNFAQADDLMQYKLEIVSDGEKKEVDLNNLTGKEISKMSVAQVTDVANDVSFIFEPNELSSFICSPITFMRPDDSGQSVAAGMTLSMALCWKINLSAGMEMEKTINFSIISTKKRSKQASIK